MNPANNFNSSSSSFHFFDLNEPPKPGHEQHGLIINHAPLPHQQAAASSSASPTFFSVTQDYQSRSSAREYHQSQQKADQKIKVPVAGLSVNGHVSSASSFQPTNGDSVKDHIKMADHENRSTSTNGHGSIKWMSSKMRVMRKATPSNKSSETDICIPAKSINANCSNSIISADHRNSSTVEIVRVCSDCNTTKTPLWRGGPQGPKSLCNACGIRRRKARKAMAVAASAQHESGIVNSTEASTIHSKEKEMHTSYHDVTRSHQTTATSKLSFEDFAVNLINKKPTELFPPEEEEAAILLMALSCGLIQS